MLRKLYVQYTSPTIHLPVRIFPLIVVLLVTTFAITFAPPAYAQSLPLGTISGPSEPYACTAARNGSMFYPGMQCINVSVVCPGTDTIQATFGYIGPSSPIGTIVFFSAGPGTAPVENGDDTPTYANYYYTHNYEIVQFEWASPWEKAHSNGTSESVLSAACRPATLLNYLSNTFFASTKPSCAQGSSAGTAAIAYSMSWYGAGSYLKNIELLAGPVLSKIDQGCIYSNPPTVTLCGSGANYSCSTGTTSWTDSAQYVPNDQSQINNWTGTGNSQNPGCASSGVTQQELTTWAAMSIVDGSKTGYTPVFAFPTTTRHGWLCAGPASNYQNGTCTSPDCPNNSSAQGGYWYNAVGSSGDANLTVTGTNSCNGPEGVSQGGDPAGGSEESAIRTDMTTKCQ